MTTWTSSNLGYPRLGEKREWKKALESYWKGKLDEGSFQHQIRELRLDFLKKQKERGVDSIPVGDFSLYDHVLDTSVMFGLVPDRFDASAGYSSLSTYFAVARGTKASPASEMTKWFNTNYHYIVPELQNAKPRLVDNYPLKAYQEAASELGIEGRPYLIGPYTFLKLSKGYEEHQFEQLFNDLLPLYQKVLQQLQDAGAKSIQIDEPAFVQSFPETDIPLIRKAYELFNREVPGLDLFVQTYFDSVSHYKDIIALPIAGLGLDFVHGKDGNWANVQNHGFPSDKVLGAGVIDGRNIWKADVSATVAFAKDIQSETGSEHIEIQPSCSLLHTPVTTRHETQLDPLLLDALSFADQKLEEINLVTRTLNGEDTKTELEQNTAQLDRVKNAPWRQEAAGSTAADIPSSRPLSFEERSPLQQEKFQLPKLPTTTIGSFPQTREVRVERRRVRKGEISAEEYETYIQNKMQEWVDIQEEIGLDVLVHGEFERTDMVEFFGEKLGGFAFTSNGWVQSYGSRCVKPPVIYGNVEFKEPMTVNETKYAQTLTEKPMKGMLTGPVTILNWSFERNDIPKKEVAFQIARALNDEVLALENEGIEMIQVDEPAIREGLPLKRAEWDEYLEWTVHAFRLSTSSVKDTTQIHTHMCYSEFQDMIESIRALDADVISIETSRSHGELIETFETAVYDKGIGLGVYDIHSPRVPEVEEMTQMIDRALRVLPSNLFWVNPDCGLKTRDVPETIEALKNMVRAAEEARKNLEQHA